MKYWPILTLFVIATIGWALLSHKTPVCPEDFTNSEEKVVAFDTWTKDFYERNPNASETELANARIDFYQQNHCEQSLKRVQDFESGNVDPATQDTVEMEVKRMHSP